MIPSAQALVGAAQLNAIEFHTWNSTAAAIGQQDRMIFDLDPGEGVEWPHIQEAAILTRAMREELGQQSWLKTSGVKGLHVVVPLDPKADYDTVNAFSKAVVQHMAKTIPSRFVAVAGGGNRVGKILARCVHAGHWDQLATLEGGAKLDHRDGRGVLGDARR